MRRGWRIQPSSTSVYSLRLPNICNTTAEGMAVVVAGNCCTSAAVRRHPIHIMPPIRLTSSAVRSCATFLSPVKCRVRSSGPLKLADLRSASYGSYSELGSRQGVILHDSRKCQISNDRHLATLARGTDAYKTFGHPFLEVSFEIL